MSKLLRIDPAVCFLAALLLLLLPFDWLVSAIAAAVWHELCHIAAICLSGGAVTGIQVRIGGTQIHAKIEKAWQELFCALAGPLGSFFLLTGSRFFPKLAICAFAQGIFNLLPVYPMDGGRAMRSLFCILFPQSGYIVWERLQKVLLFLVFAGITVIVVRFPFWKTPILTLLLIFWGIAMKKTLQTGRNQGTIVLPFVKR